MSLPPPGAVDAAYLATADATSGALRGLARDALAPLDGATVLDLGCGAGDGFPPLLAALGPRGRLIGLEPDPILRRAALARAAGDARISVVDGHAEALPLPDASLDAAQALWVVQHLSDPAAAVAGLARALRPAGRVVLLDVDWATLSIEGGDPRTERRLKDALLDHDLRQPTAGRRLPGLLHAARFQRVGARVLADALIDPSVARRLLALDAVEARALAHGLVTPGEIDAWRADLVAAARAGRFFAHAVTVAATGRRPG
jgi:SAM-dependent methyltransferase